MPGMRAPVVDIIDTEIYAPRNVPYAGVWVKRARCPYFALNVIHTTMNILRARGVTRIVGRYQVVANSITQTEFCHTISNVLEARGYARTYPLAGPATKPPLSANYFKAYVSTYIQECCRHNKQRYIYNSHHLTDDERSNIYSSLYRPILFVSPDAWTWLNHGGGYRWQSAKVTGERSPTFIRYFAV